MMATLDNLIQTSLNLPLDHSTGKKKQRRAGDEVRQMQGKNRVSLYMPSSYTIAPVGQMLRGEQKVLKGEAASLLWGRQRSKVRLHMPTQYAGTNKALSSKGLGLGKTWDWDLGLPMVTPGYDIAGQSVGFYATPACHKASRCVEKQPHF